MVNSKVSQMQKTHDLLCGFTMVNHWGLHDSITIVNQLKWRMILRAFLAICQLLLRCTQRPPASRWAICAKTEGSSALSRSKSLPPNSSLSGFWKKLNCPGEELHIKVEDSLDVQIKMNNYFKVQRGFRALHGTKSFLHPRNATFGSFWILFCGAILSYLFQEGNPSHQQRFRLDSPRKCRTKADSVYEPRSSDRIEMFRGLGAQWSPQDPRS